MGPRTTAAARTAAGLILASMLFPAPAAQAQQQRDPGDRSVSIGVNNASLADAIRLIFTSARVSYRVDPSAAEALKAAHITASLEQLPLRVVLDTLFRNAGSANRTVFSYKVVSGVYVISARTPPERPGVLRSGRPGPPPGPSPRDTVAALTVRRVELVDADLYEALDAVLGQVPVSYVFPDDSATGHKITLSISNAPLGGVLESILIAGQPRPGLVADIDSVIAFEARPGPGSAVDPSSRPVTLHYEDADIRYALRALFRTVGANYAIDQDVAGRVTISLAHVPFDAALMAVLKAAPEKSPLLYRVENGVYYIRVRKGPAPGL